MQEDGEYREIHWLEAGPSPDEDTRLEDYEEEFLPTCSEKKVGKTGEEDPIFYDDVTGVQLSTEGVLKAREEELAWVHKAKIYEKRPLDECWSVTGKPPITLKWIDRNKGDRERPNYRSHIVVREIKKQHGALPRHMLFSNMPPLEAAKLLCSDLATRKKSRSGKALQLALCDISPGDEQEGMCALLLKTMYGTQDAAHVWQDDYSSHLKNNNFIQGSAWTSVFRHKDRDIKLLDSWR